MKDVFLDVYKSFSSEQDFKVAWFDLSMILDSIVSGRFCSILLYFIVCIVQSDAPKGERKNILTPETAVNLRKHYIYYDYIYLFIFFAQVGMALILLYLLLLCIGTKCTRV